jgi:hypothetical protein
MLQRDRANRTAHGLIERDQNVPLYVMATLRSFTSSERGGTAGAASIARERRAAEAMTAPEETLEEIAKTSPSKMELCIRRVGLAAVPPIALLPAGRRLEL